MSKFNDRTGETRTMNNGLRATIINYRNALDVDVQFENSMVVYNRGYSKFLKGRIKCPIILEYIDDYVKATNPNIGLEFLIDADDIEIAKSRLWTANIKGYIAGTIDGNDQYLHRLIMNAPDGVDVDHIYGDKSDLRKRNMRICTRSENLRNQSIRSDNTSGYKGVSWNKKNERWEAYIKADGKRKYLKHHDTAEAAAIAYNEAAIKYFGEFARLNELQ